MSRHPKRHQFQTILALDAYYLPMVVVTRRKALKAMATGRAHALDLRTWTKMGIADVASRPFHAIVFPNAKAAPEAKLGIGRGAAGIMKRDAHRCQYCGQKGDTLDHVVPKCQGGASTWSNLVSCCRSCNAKKGGHRPEEVGMTLRRPIRSPRALMMDRLHELTRS